MTVAAKAFTIQVPDKFTTVWNSQKPYQIWYGGRYSAKSWTKAIYFLAKSMTQSYNRTVFARDTQKNVRNSQYQLLKDVSERFECFKGRFAFADTFMKITCRQNGNFLIGGSFEQPDTLRSVADPTDFWAEEPITRSNEISRQDFFDIVGSLRNAEGIQTQFHFTFNPISKTSWIYKDFFESNLYDCEKLFVNFWDNPFCPQSGLDFLESLKRVDSKRYKVDGLGEWGIAYEGLIYPQYEPLDEFPGDVQFYGLDFGYNDPCVLTAGRILDIPAQAKKDYIVHELLYETGHDGNSLADRFDTLKISKIKPIIYDNSRPEMALTLKNRGYNMKPCVKYAGSVKDGIGEVKKYNLRIVSGSRNLLDEISTYVFEAKDEKLLEEPADNQCDHAMDAMRYALESVRKPTGKFYSQ